MGPAEGGGLAVIIFAKNAPQSEMGILLYPREAGRRSRNCNAILEIFTVGPRRAVGEKKKENLHDAMTIKDNVLASNLNVFNVGEKGSKWGRKNGQFGFLIIAIGGEGNSIFFRDKVKKAADTGRPCQTIKDYNIPMDVNH